MIPKKDDNPTRTFPIITVSLIALNIFFFYIEITSPHPQNIIMAYGLIPANVFSEPQNIISSMFLHGSIMHIGGNMLYLWIFGNNIEDVFGRIKFILFYVFCGTVAAMAHALLNLGSKVPLIGASGAISGILGAYLVLFPWARVRTLIFFFYFIRIVSIPAYFIITFWFIWQILGVYMGGGSGVAYLAHIGGFIPGLIIAQRYKKNITKKLYTKRTRMHWVN